MYLVRGVLSPREGVLSPRGCLPEGCMPKGTVSCQGGVCPRGVSAQGGVCLGGICLRGVSARGCLPGGASVHVGIPHPPPRKYNLTPASLRAVTNARYQWRIQDFSEAPKPKVEAPIYYKFGQFGPKSYMKRQIFGLTGVGCTSLLLPVFIVNVVMAAILWQTDRQTDRHTNLSDFRANYYCPQRSWSKVLFSQTWKCDNGQNCEHCNRTPCQTCLPGHIHYRRQILL